MPDPKQPQKPRSTEEILREMEAMSKGSSDDPPSPSKPAEGGGALKSLLGFFVKIVPDEETAPPPPVKTPTAPLPPPKAPTAPLPSGPPPQVQVKTSVGLPPSGPPTGPRVADLVADEPPPTFAEVGTDADDLSQKPFEDIYRQAGVTDSPCSVNELEKLLSNPTVVNQPLSVKVIAVNLTLSAKGIGFDVPIADAVRRDRALDAYQSMLAERARTTEQRNLSIIDQMTKEIEEYLKRKQAEIDRLRTEVSEMKRQSTDFAVRRETEEKRMANLISPFLEGMPNPVTVGNNPESDK